MIEFQDIDTPLRQARQCLDAWLAEEEAALPERERRRAAALLALYFHGDADAEMNMTGFLRHYSGHREALPGEDAGALRMELKSLLDGCAPAPPKRARLEAPACIVAALLCVWLFAQGDPAPRGPAAITTAQQAMLKSRVDHIVELEDGLSHHAVWALVKRPLAVRSYRDIPPDKFDASLAMLSAWEERLTNPSRADAPTGTP